MEGSSGTKAAQACRVGAAPESGLKPAGSLSRVSPPTTTPGCTSLGELCQVGAASGSHGARLRLFPFPLKSGKVLFEAARKILRVQHLGSGCFWFTQSPNSSGRERKEQMPLVRCHQP